MRWISLFISLCIQTQFGHAFLHNTFSMWTQKIYLLCILCAFCTNNNKYNHCICKHFHQINILSHWVAWRLTPLSVSTGPETCVKLGPNHIISFHLKQLSSAHVTTDICHIPVFSVHTNKGIDITFWPRLTQLLWCVFVKQKSKEGYSLVLSLHLTGIVQKERKICIFLTHIYTNNYRVHLWYSSSQSPWFT